MRGIDIPGAQKYNLEIAKGGKLWKQTDLPWPLNLNVSIPIIGSAFLIPIDSIQFALSVATFQAQNGLLPDGKLGPATFAVMSAMDDIAPDGESAHDFDEEPLNEEMDPDEDDVDNGRNVSASISIKPEKVIGYKPARSNVSNCLIIAGESVKLSDELLSLGITASNYLDDDEYQFKNFRKRKAAKHFVLHESVTMSGAQTNRVLDKKRARSAKNGKNGGRGYQYGIHLNLEPNGHITCHADLVFHRLVHANQINNTSVGIEITNPYNPKFGRGPFTNIIEGPWWCWKPANAERLYTLPTAPQLRALLPLCKFIADHINGIPMEFPTRNLDGRRPRIERWDEGASPPPGIVAHRDFSTHADGRYPLEYIIQQLESDDLA